MGQVAAWV
jgi:hypothetical protein